MNPQIIAMLLLRVVGPETEATLLLQGLLIHKILLGIRLTGHHTHYHTSQTAVA